MNPIQYTGAQQLVPLPEFTPTTGNEINLWNEWQKSVAQCNSLQATIEKLQEKVDLLLKKSEQQKPKTEEYHTDEEDLARETEWIVQKKRGSKKRKANTSPDVSPQQQQKAPAAGTSKNAGDKKVLPPPPINLVGIENYEDIIKIMQNASIITYRVKILNGVHKVNVYTEEEYRRLQKNLKDCGIEHYTYEDKNTRPIKVMARGIDSTCPEEMIVEYLKDKQLAIQEVVNIQKREKKGDAVIRKRLPLFMLVFHKQEDIKKIYDIQNILGLKVRIEPLRKRSALIPQCKRCQGYGHTQKSCFKLPRCVKCAGKHLTSECEKPNNQTAKCANCSEAHPANYRGCMVAKELQKIRNDVMRKQKLNMKCPNITKPKMQQENPTQKSVAKPKAKEEKTYAQIIKGKETKIKKDEQTEPDSTSQMLQKIMAKLEQQEKTNKMILNRINKLESGNKKAAVKERKSK